MTVWHVLNAVLTVAGALALLGAGWLTAWVILHARRVQARREAVAVEAEYAATLDVDALLRAWAAEGSP